MNISRRSFLKLGAITLGAASLSNMVSPALADALSSGAAEAKVVPGLQIPAGLDGRPAQKLILGNFVTMEENRPTAKAMTVIDGRIQFIGSVETALTLCDDDTEVMDYGENYLYPGFMEAHCHPSLAGERLIGAANLVPGKSLEDYVAIMKDYIAKYPDREFYKGAGWVLREVNPTRTMLDAICPDKPMVLNSADGHSVWCNTKMLEKGNITPECAQEIGVDQIRVDEDGQPTGFISEKVAMKLQNMLAPTLEERAEQLMAWQKFAFENGYTAVGDAGLNESYLKSYHINVENSAKKQFAYEAGHVHNEDAAGLNEEHLQGYKAAAENKDWKLRTYGSYYLDEHTEDMEGFVQNVAEVAAKYNSEYIKVVGIKCFMDGVVEAHTGWLIDGYDDEPDYHGVERFNDAEKLGRVVQWASEHGMNVHIHSIGDAASRCALDAIEHAQKETGNYDQRNVLAHLQVIRPEDIRRLADNHVIAAVAPLWVPKEPDYWPNEVKCLGEERAEACYPIQAFRNEGATIVFHTDYPVTAIVNIPHSIFRAVTRFHNEWGKDSQRKSDEAIARRDALLALTRNVAYMWHEENRLGTLEVGKIANLSIYDTDFINCELNAIADAKHIATVVDGDEVYAS